MLTKIRTIIRELGHLTPMALVMLFLPALGSITLIAFIDPVGDWLGENRRLGAFVYFLATAVFCGLSLIPTNVIGLVGGWAFGFWLGLFVLMGGIVSAAIISFFINSKISGRKLPNAASKHIKIDGIYRALMRDDYWRTTLIIFLLRVSVIMPFAFTNFLLASARVPLSSYIIGTFGGMLPRSATMVFVGAGLAHLDPQSSRDMIALFIGIAATICAIIVIARFSRKALEKVAATETESELRSLAEA